jgi:hypothetical protein
LHDAIRRRLGSRSDLDRLAVLLDPDVEARGRRLLPQRIEPRQAGRWSARCGLIRLAQDIEYRRQLSHCLAARCFDRRERGTRLLQPAVDHVPGDAGLHIHQRDVVREDVMQLARDPEPLVARPAARLLLLYAGPLRRTFAVRSHDLGTDEDHQQSRADGDEVKRLRRRIAGYGAIGHVHGVEQRRPNPSGPAMPAHNGGVDANDRAQDHRPVGVAEHHVHERCHERDREHSTG